MLRRSLNRALIARDTFVCPQCQLLRTSERVFHLPSIKGSRRQHSLHEAAPSEKARIKPSSQPRSKGKARGATKKENGSLPQSSRPSGPRVRRLPSKDSSSADPKSSVDAEAAENTGTHPTSKVLRQGKLSSSRKLRSLKRQKRQKRAGGKTSKANDGAAAGKASVDAGIGVSDGLKHITERRGAKTRKMSAATSANAAVESSNAAEESDGPDEANEGLSSAVDQRAESAEDAPQSGQQLEEKKTSRTHNKSKSMKTSGSSLRSQMQAILRAAKRGEASNGAQSLKDALKASPYPSIPGIQEISADSLNLDAVDFPKDPVPGLSYGLDRVLFTSGVLQLQDLTSRVYNFDPYLQKPMAIEHFDFDALTPYITSSKDTTLVEAARSMNKSYAGSTSSMTGTLSHFHYLLSHWRPLNTNVLSQSFPARFKNFTKLTRAPNAIFLKWKDGAYAIDADKEFDQPNILTLLGKSLEKLLTLDKAEFERYRRGSSNPISEAERNKAESYNYTTSGDFLMRSQLDAYNERLPGTGMFDLKTRACIGIRMTIRDYAVGMGYEIKTAHGEWESFEREYYDMMRAAMLKYSLQVRMGRMEGIFVAFHNIARIFGFQYVPLKDLDLAIHGQDDTTLGDTEFKLSLKLLNEVLDRATERFPKKSLRIHFETRDAAVPFMYIFAEPMDDAKVEEIQEAGNEANLRLEQEILGLQKSHTEATDQAVEETEREWESFHSEVDKAIAQDETSYEASEGPTQTEASSSPIGGSDSSRRSASETDSNGLLQATEEAYRGDSDSSGQEDAFTSTSSSADSQFLNDLDSTIEDLEPDGDLLAMVLTIRNSVNGQHVQRPESFGQSDRWSIEYSLADVERPSRAWALYGSCQARRRVALEETKAEESDEEKDYFLNLVKRYCIEGKKWRNARDAQDVGKPIVMWDGSVLREHTRSNNQAQVSGTESYIDWLYKTSHNSTAERAGFAGLGPSDT